MSDEKKNEQNEQWAKFAAALTRKLVATGKFEAVPHGVRAIRVKK